MSDERIPEGFVFLARKIRKSSLWRCLKATHRIVLIELLLQAQFKDGEVVRNGEILFLKRGQIATSYQNLVDDIADKDISLKVVRNAIEKLIKHDFLAKDEAKSRAKKGLLLTVVNYDLYQTADNYSGKAADKSESENEVRTNHEESKSSFSGKATGKANNEQNPFITGVNRTTYKNEGKEKGITRAEQGQSEGKAGAINKNVKNLKKEKNDYQVEEDKRIVNLNEVFRFSFNYEPTPAQIELLGTYIDQDGMEEELVIWVLREVGQRGKDFAYAKGWLNRSVSSKILTLSEAIKANEEHERKKQQFQATRRPTYGKQSAPSVNVPDWLKPDAPQIKTNSQQEEKNAKWLDSLLNNKVTEEKKCGL
jgi:DNA replication protein DnaD